MKKETKATIIEVAKEGFIRPTLASLYEFADAWSCLFFANHIENLSKRGGVYDFNRRGYNTIIPLSYGKKFPGVTIAKSVDELKPKPVEPPTRKIDADKLLEKVHKAHNKAIDNDGDWLSDSYGDDTVAQHALDDAYWAVEDWVDDLLKEVDYETSEKT